MYGKAREAVKSGTDDAQRFVRDAASGVTGTPPTTATGSSASTGSSGSGYSSGSHAAGGHSGGSHSDSTGGARRS
jgi:hypothetical protein